MPIQGNPTGAAGQGGNRAGQVLSGYVFASGIHQPEVSSILSYKYPQYYLTSLLDRMGATKPVAQNEWSWFVQDRTRKHFEVASVDAGGTTGGSTATLTAANTTTAEGYFIVGDVLRAPGGDVVRITAVADNAGDVQISVVTLDGSNFGTALAADDQLGHVGTSFEEGSAAPDSRYFSPSEEVNYTHTLRRSINITGSEFTNRTWLDDGESWYFTIQDLEEKEFRKDQENILLFGTKSSTTTSGRKRTTTRGIWDYYLNDGVVTGYADAATDTVFEQSLQDHIKDLMVEGASKELTVLCGSSYLVRMQRALKDYQVNGGIAYGSFGMNTVGLDVQQYKFMGMTINFVYYELFDDPEVLPSQTPADPVYDFSECSLWLDLGSGASGEPLISMVYKELDGNSRKLLMRIEAGMMSPVGDSDFVASGDDAFKIHYLSEIGVEVRLPNRGGIHLATS